MDARAFEIFVGLLGTLTSRQMSKVVTVLDHLTAQVKAADVIERAATANLECPRCRSREFYRTVKPMGLSEIAVRTVRRLSIH